MKPNDIFMIHDFIRRFIYVFIFFAIVSCGTFYLNDILEKHNRINALKIVNVVIAALDFICIIALSVELWSNFTLLFNYWDHNYWSIIPYPVMLIVLLVLAVRLIRKNKKYQ
ncbi:hypothetical protein [Lactobacillus sp. PV034]|uniref:hypothetical protein n=1 Tax=Lactobacillus sp. PV034 TaxID=2594495 RepID=UPI00223F9AA5|nr:hypothetical protein [Lactobacillus sp. PV034]QNQ81087.1 hypothetical protein FP432_05705 [Lactobacillus sp. PV034]